MKDPEYVYVAVIFDEVSDSIVSKKQYAHVARGSRIAVPKRWKPYEVLSPIVDPLKGLGCGLWIVCSNVLEMSWSQRWASSVHAISAMNGCAALSLDLR